MSEKKIIYLPKNQEVLFLKIRKLKKKKEKDNLKILNSINREIMPNSISINLETSTSSISDEMSKIERTINDKLEYGQLIGNVSIKDEETATTYYFKMYQTYGIDGPNIHLTNKKHEICGQGIDWYDESDDVPDDFKSDGVVCRPPDYYEPIISFIINGNTPLTNKTYREFRYLEDHGNLQNTNQVKVRFD